MGIRYFVASVIANSVVYLSSCSISSERSTGNTNTARDHLSTDIFLGTLKRNLPKGKIRWPPPAHLFLVAPKVTQPLLKALESAQRPNRPSRVFGWGKAGLRVIKTCLHSTAVLTMFVGVTVSSQAYFPERGEAALRVINFCFWQPSILIYSIRSSLHCQRVSFQN